MLPVLLVFLCLAVLLENMETNMAHARKAMSILDVFFQSVTIRDMCFKKV